MHRTLRSSTYSAKGSKSPSPAAQTKSRVRCCNPNTALSSFYGLPGHQYVCCACEALTATVTVKERQYRGRGFFGCTALWTAWAKRNSANAALLRPNYC